MKTEKDIQNDIDAMNMNLPQGSKVIVKSADENNYSIGTMIGPTPVSKAQKIIPLVDIDGKEYMCFGIVRLYDERVTRALDKLTGEEQWNVMAKNYIIGE